MTDPNSGHDTVFFAVNAVPYPASSVVYEEEDSSVSSFGSVYEPINAIVAYLHPSPGYNLPAYVDVSVTDGGANGVCDNTTFPFGGTSDGGGAPCSPGGLVILANAAEGFIPAYSAKGFMVASTSNQICGPWICYVTPLLPLNAPEGIAVDGDNHIWIANSGDASVSTYTYTSDPYISAFGFGTTPVRYPHDSVNGGTMTSPFDLGIDNSGNVWMTNAGCVSTDGATCLPGPFVLSELVGAAAPTITPLAAQYYNNTTGSRPTGLVRKLTR